jgi:DNA repair photolyase
MIESRKDIKGRGASSNATNRFEKTTYEAELQEWDAYLEEETPKLKTQIFKDTSRTILSENSSPDIGFRYSINCYRGCEHGCAYCYARPTHEYLGFSAGLDFESKIMIKENAAALLREKLQSKSWQPEMIMLSGNTDCYQPLERQYRLTRACLEVLAEFRNPVGIITKNQLVLRDLDLLQELARYRAVIVFLSVTSLKDELCAKLEPRTSRPRARLRAMEVLAKCGIPVGVNVAPSIPGLTDHEMPAILKAASEAGAKHAGFTPLRLPLAVAPLFEEWLGEHAPEQKDRVLNAVRSIRGGKLNDSRFSMRMKGEGAHAENMEKMFDVFTRKHGLNLTRIELSAAHFMRPGKPGDQLMLSLD